MNGMGIANRAKRANQVEPEVRAFSPLPRVTQKAQTARMPEKTAKPIMRRKDQ